VAISTRSRRLVALRSFLRFAAREEWLPGDLGTTIDVPKLPERLPKPLEAGDRDQLLDALPHDTLPKQRDRALILLLLSTGARISEILRLDRSDWKPERLWVLGKGDRERVVHVTDKARAAVENYLTARDDHSPALFIGFQPASKTASSNRLTGQHPCAQSLAGHANRPPRSKSRYNSSWAASASNSLRVTRHGRLNPNAAVNNPSSSIPHNPQRDHHGQSRSQRNDHPLVNPPRRNHTHLMTEPT
jgi:integrase